MGDTVYDSKGVPILRGDLLRSFHFKDGRRNTYLHHVAVLRKPDDRYMHAEPAEWLDQRNERGGGSFPLAPSLATKVEVIQGLSEGVAWYERNRRQVAADASAD